MSAAALRHGRLSVPPASHRIAVALRAPCTFADLNSHGPPSSSRPFARASIHRNVRSERSCAQPESRAEPMHLGTESIRQERILRQGEAA
jgi:hypothetical protein